MSADWPTTRAQIIEAFNGEQPGAPLEQTIIDLYEANPNAVINSIQPVATSLNNGRINSGWAVLKKAAAERAIATTNPTINREKLVRNADQWMRNAGVHYNRWHEVEDDLFGDHGRLRTIDTPKLRSRYHDAWNDIKHLGDQVELEAEQRAEQRKTHQQKLAAKPKIEPVDVTEAAA